MSTILDVFGRKIKALRRIHKMTQEQLAVLSGLSIQYVGEIERGRRNPSLTSVENLANALGLPIAELFNLEEFKMPTDKQREILSQLIEEADEKQLGKFFNMSQTFLR
ncbi:MAG: helix-turn-helix transcriptional regulator [Desulfovibrionaceae bacterium]|nr:helix-turn-helix transcriptional regulator [Desulfovibrionaceae bacterium]MBF0514480.1 helix-turn-helix transcriptional regulator [Desulfovibrionaceae bacterium]